MGAKVKLPVIRAFSAGLALLFGKAGELVRGLWLPALIMMGVSAYIAPGYLEASMRMATADETSDPAEVFAIMASVSGSVGLLYLAMAIVYPMMWAGNLKYIIRGQILRTPFYLQFGMDEARLLISIILLVAMLGLAYGAGALAVVALGAALTAVAPAIGGAITLVAVLAFFLAMVWFVLRMSLTIPATVGVQKIGVAESFRVTKGNSLRLLAYWSLWMIVLLVAALIFFAAVMPAFFGAFLDIINAAAVGEEAATEARKRMMQLQRDLWDMSKPGFWLFAAASYVYSIAQTAIWNVAGGVAYRYLSDKESA